MSDQQFKNLLVEYKGGGFNGNWWQWNYFYWDSMGEFHNLFSSGRRGIKGEESAIELVQKTKQEEYRFYVNNIQHYSQNITLVDTTNEEEIIQFVSGGNGSNMIALALSNEELGECLKGECEECGNVFSVLEMNPDNWMGEGGVMYSPHDLFCEQCLWNLEESDNEGE